jgi:hypothetical protein
MIYFGETMNFSFIVTFLLPLIAGSMYFLMAFQVKRTSKFRSIMFGEIGFRKLETAFILFGIYFITRPLQNILGTHPWPLIINCTRQLFLMALISPSILVAIFHWVPTPSGAPRSNKFAAYSIGVLMGIIFVLINTIAVTESKIISIWGNIAIYDPMWFHSQSSIQLVLIHLTCQFVSPVGFLLLAAAYVRHRRHNYTLTNIYNLMPTKWKYLEASLIIFAVSFILAGIAAIAGLYYTYLWTIYFTGAIISGFFEMKSIKLPPRQIPNDLKKI